MKKWIFTLVVFINLEGLELARAHERVLFLGDSHSYGVYGTVIDGYFRKTASKVVSIASCGSSPSTWTSVKANFKTTNCGYWRKERSEGEVRVKSQKLESFSTHLDQVKPDLVVLSLGTNILASRSNVESELKSIDLMMEQVKKTGADCIWIGPPDLAKSPFKDNLKYGIEKIKSQVEKYSCRYIDSSKITSYPSGKSDGIHYGPADSRKWGESVTQQISGMRWSSKISSAGENTSNTSGVRTSTNGAK